MMQRVLVTGANGFIGSYFINYLLSKGMHVRALIRSAEKQKNLPDGVEIIIGDLTKSNTLSHCCDDIDTVFHLGGYAHAFGKEKVEAEKHRAINLDGTRNLLEEAVLSNVKQFIYFSSVKAVSESETCIDEKWDRPADTAYGLAKREAEKSVLAVGQKTGMHVTVLRPALVYGPNWKGNLASMLRAIDKGIFLPIPETNNRRSLVSIEDISNAALLAAANPTANGKIYFVTDGRYYSTRQLYIWMQEALGKRVSQWYFPLSLFKCLAYVGDWLGKITHRRMPFNSESLAKLFGSAEYDARKIQDELGFKPIYDFKAMLPKIVAAYKS